MAIKASRIDVWTTTIDDRAGAVAEKLEPLARAGADLELVFARRTPEQLMGGADGAERGHARRSRLCR